jgi:hypothetical protein
VFALLIGIGIATATLVWTSEQRRVALDTHEHDIAGRVEGFTTTARNIAAFQTAYVALAQPLEPSLNRVAADLQTLDANVTGLASSVRSNEAASRLPQIKDDVTNLAAADRTIRENLRAGETLMASDLIFGEARHTIDGIVLSLRELHDAESSSTSVERQRLDQQVWSSVAGASAVWLLGLMLLVRLPKAQGAVSGATAASPEPQTTDASTLRLVPEPTASPAPDRPIDDGHTSSMRLTPEAPWPASVDLAAAADVCTAMSRVTSTEALTDLLGRAAAVLDAPGVIVWMGAGEELFPAIAYGYDARVVSRLGAIARFADNATSNAWVMGQLRTVPGDSTTNGAIVAPMFGSDSCIGVLAAEVRHGRENDPATQAVTVMFAAQLATAVVAWPAPSSAETKAG